MLKRGILNPQLAALLCRFRHTNEIVIADQGFPFWPSVETIDLSLVDGQPTVLQVLDAIVPHLDIDHAYMASQFLEANPDDTQKKFKSALGPHILQFVAHTELKLRVPKAIGLIRTGDSTQYANVVLSSGIPPENDRA